MVRLLSLLILLLLPNPFTSRGPSRDVTHGQPTVVTGVPVAHPAADASRERVPSVATRARAAPRVVAPGAALREPVPATPDSTPASNDLLEDPAPEPPRV